MQSLPRVTRIIAPTRSMVTAILQEAIAKRQLRPGMRITERALAAQLGISRATLREALRELETVGLLQRDPRGFLIVPEFDGNRARAIYELREVLEGLAASLFALRATDQELQRIQEELEYLRAAATEGNATDYLLHKNRYYAILIEGARNPVLADFLNSLQWHFRFLRSTSLQAPGRLLRSLHEMEDLTRALCDRNAVLAENLARVHIRNALAALLQRLAAAATSNDPGSAELPAPSLDGEAVDASRRGGAGTRIW